MFEPIAKRGMADIIDGKDIVSVTHLKDVDGISSAAILKHVFGSRVKEVIFSDFEKKAIEESLAIIKKVNPVNSVVIFSDLSFGEAELATYKQIFETLKQGNNIIVWLDHHPISSSSVMQFLVEHADYVIAGENKDYCGAELVAEHIAKALGKYDQEVERIAYVAHISDFNLRNKDPIVDKKLDKVSMAIASYLDDNTGIQEGLFKMVEAFVADPYDFDKNEFIQEKARLYEEKQNVLKSELKDNSYVIDFNGHKAVIGFNYSGSLQTNDGCSFLLNLPNAAGAEMAIYVKAQRGTGHIRVIDKSEIDSVPFAQSMGGNGHPHASAFGLPKQVDKNKLQSSNDIERRDEQEKFAKSMQILLSEFYKGKDRKIIKDA
ncbi:MAG: DHH family phosphoesterase [Candidatus Micrarchaeia archaeon]